MELVLRAMAREGSDREPIGQTADDGGFRGGADVADPKVSAFEEESGDEGRSGNRKQPVARRFMRVAWVFF